MTLTTSLSARLSPLPVSQNLDKAPQTTLENKGQQPFPLRGRDQNPLYASKKSRAPNFRRASSVGANLSKKRDDIESELGKAYTALRTLGDVDARKMRNTIKVLEGQLEAVQDELKKTDKKLMDAHRQIWTQEMEKKVAMENAAISKGERKKRYVALLADYQFELREKARHVKKIENLEAKEKALVEQLNSSFSQIEELERSLAGQGNAIVDLENKQDSNDGIVSGLRNRISELKAKLASAEKVINRHKEKERKKENIQALKGEISQLKRDLDTAKRDLGAATLERDKASGDLGLEVGKRRHAEQELVGSKALHQLSVMDYEERLEEGHRLHVEDRKALDEFAGMFEGLRDDLQLGKYFRMQVINVLNQALRAYDDGRMDDVRACLDDIAGLHKLHDETVQDRKRSDTKENVFPAAAS